MRLTAFVPVCLFTCLLAPSAFPSQKTAESAKKTVKVMIVSDTQYGWCRLASCHYERRNFRKIVDLVNDEGFDALIILGDLVESDPRLLRSSHEVRSGFSGKT